MLSSNRGLNSIFYMCHIYSSPGKGNITIFGQEHSLLGLKVHDKCWEGSCSFLRTAVNLTRKAASILLKLLDFSRFRAGYFISAKIVIHMSAEELLRY